MVVSLPDLKGLFTILNIYSFSVYFEEKNVFIYNIKLILKETALPLEIIKKIRSTKSILIGTYQIYITGGRYITFVDFP